MNHDKKFYIARYITNFGNISVSQSWDPPIWNVQAFHLPFSCPKDRYYNHAQAYLVLIIHYDGVYQPVYFEMLVVFFIVVYKPSRTMHSNEKFSSIILQSMILKIFIPSVEYASNYLGAKHFSMFVPLVIHKKSLALWL